MMRPTATILSIGLLLAGLASSAVFCQPKLVVDSPSSYRVGDLVDLESLVLDRDGMPHQLEDIIDPNAKLLVVIIFGGAFKDRPDEAAFRGPLWCRDSFDDLAIQRALVRRFEKEAVQFIPIAVPPVYKPEDYGWPDDPFLGRPEDDPVYQAAVGSFIAATERQKRADLLPFDTIYYDPKFRLAQNRKERELGPEFGKIYDWQGKLKWHADPRRYGTPAIWILSPEGEVLTEPLVGNDYDARPPEIFYGYAEAEERISRALQSVKDGTAMLSGTRSDFTESPGRL